MKKNIAVILCGSGYKDGSEIRESVATFYALEKLGHSWQAFAPNEWQHDVVNCQNGHLMPNEKRNMLIESARITRGKSDDLKNLRMDKFDGLVLPGGFGAAKNLCNFASHGHQAKVHGDVLKVLREFREAKKPIAAICIAPAILGLAFPNSQIRLTLGPEGPTSEEVRKVGVDVIPVNSANEWVEDKENLIYSSPAYMFDDASIPEIFSGIESCLKAAF